MTERLEQKNVPYAQIDDNGICFAVSSLSGVVDDPCLIRLEKYDTSLMGKRYMDGQWQDVERPEPEPQPSQLDRIEEAVKKSQTEIADKAVDIYTQELLERGLL